MAFLPPHSAAFKRYAMRIVDDPVEDGVCDCRFSDHASSVGTCEDQQNDSPEIHTA
jgi:hypothetical protein